MDENVNPIQAHTLFDTISSSKGKISLGDLTYLVQRNHNNTHDSNVDQVAVILMEELDRNKDGLVTFDEFYLSICEKSDLFIVLEKMRQGLSDVTDETLSSVGPSREYRNLTPVVSPGMMPDPKARDELLDLKSQLFQSQHERALMEEQLKFEQVSHENDHKKLSETMESTRLLEKNLKDTAAENEKLKRELAEIPSIIAAKAKLETQVTELRVILKDGPRANFHPASPLGRDLYSYLSQLLYEKTLSSDAVGELRAELHESQERQKANLRSFSEKYMSLESMVKDLKLENEYLKDQILELQCLKNYAQELQDRLDEKVFSPHTVVPDPDFEDFAPNLGPSLAQQLGVGSSDSSNEAIEALSNKVKELESSLSSLQGRSTRDSVSPFSQRRIGNRSTHSVQTSPGSNLSVDVISQPLNFAPTSPTPLRSQRNQLVDSAYGPGSQPRRPDLRGVSVSPFPSLQEDSSIEHSQHAINDPFRSILSTSRSLPRIVIPSPNARVPSGTNSMRSPSLQIDSEEQQQALVDTFRNYDRLRDRFSTLEEQSRHHEELLFTLSRDVKSLSSMRGWVFTALAAVLLGSYLPTPVALKGPFVHPLHLIAAGLLIQQIPWIEDQMNSSLDLLVDAANKYLAA